MALTTKLEPFEVGRALYHLAQRRGFLTNRKAGERADEDIGKVKQEIGELEQRLAETGARTIGEYFGLHVDPKIDRIRRRYTHRTMFLNEFDAIWAAQTAYWPELLTGPLKASLREAYFQQRPLKDQTDLVGGCDLEFGEKRAPMALLEVQRFRFLSASNNLKLIDTSGRESRLTPDQRSHLLQMSLQGDRLSLTSVKKRLKLPAGVKFTLENGGEENLPGNPTAFRMRKAMGLAWEELKSDEQERLVRWMIAQPGTIEEIAEKLEGAFGLDEATALSAAKVQLPEGYYSISAAAIDKLMPHLENGATYAEARTYVYGEVRRSEPVGILPSLNEEQSKRVVGDIRNPIVLRALSEFRKTVNAIVRKFGRPDYVHIELARDIRKGVAERNKLGQRNRAREKQRAEAASTLSAHLGLPFDRISRRDLEKYMLWQECGHQCPYSGRIISLGALFGDHAHFHVEHIVPFAASLDDSFDNKTLCYHELNSIKRDRTPWEAFGASDDWEVMTARVKGWNNARKFRRFTISETEKAVLLEEFSSRQLNDTRYASRLAAQYAGMLYGGTVDREGRQRVRTCSGPITAWLRNEWQLDRILNPNRDGKSREDHRHHVIDAVTVAMCSGGIVQRLSSAASKAMSAGRRRFGVLESPWDGFAAQVATSVAATVVSTKPEYKLQDQMHDETLYGRPRSTSSGKQVTHVRKEVTGVKVEDIVDPRVRAAVDAKVKAVGSTKKLEGDWPLLIQKGGKAVPIRRVRVRVRASPDRLSEDKRERWVLPYSLHHVEIVRNESAKKVNYDHYPVTTIEALRRHQSRAPVVQREFGEREAFVCSLRKGDVLEATIEGRLATLWSILTVKSKGVVVMKPLTDARTKADSIADKTSGLVERTVNRLFLDGARKVSISHLGEVSSARD